MLDRNASACWVFTERGQEKTPKTQFLLFLVKKDILFFCSYSFIVCVFMCVRTRGTHCSCVKVRGQLVGSLLSLSM